MKHLFQWPHWTNGDTEVQTGSHLPQIKSQGYIPTLRKSK